MAQLKYRKADLISKYKITIEVSLILSLLVTIFAFKFFPDIPKNEKQFEVTQELITIEDVNPQTSQSLPPPPPPKPNIIIAVPSDAVLEDVEIQSSDLEINQEVAPPPPPKKEKVRIEEEPAYFVAVEEMPSPIGGIQAIINNLVYPEIAIRAGITGTVYVLAYLDEKGNVVKTEITKGLAGGCNEAAQQAVKKTKFNPGKQRGIPVRVKVMVPIKFQLNS